MRVVLQTTDGILDYHMVYDLGRSLYNMTITYDEGKVTAGRIVELLKKEGYDLHFPGESGFFLPYRQTGQ